MRIVIRVALAAGFIGAITVGTPAPVPAQYYPSPRVYVPVVTLFNWTGFYIGGNLGAAWTQDSVSDSFGNSWSSAQQAVFTGGGQVGANYQINWLVVGVEADFDWMTNNHISNAASTPISALQLSADDRWMTTLAARAGVAADNWLFYGKGGGGWVGVNNPTITNVGGSISVSNSNGNSGWLAGAGVEWAFAPNWTAKLEYDFLGLGSKSYTVTASGIFSPINGDVITVPNRDVQTLTVGINYLWH
jgi:outer membrane immunogenic protein